MVTAKVLIKSPQYTGGDFMFLYWFVRRRRRPQTFFHVIIFEQLCGFLSFLAWLVTLAYKLPDYILVDFRCDLDLEFSRSNMEFAISQPKMVRLPRNKMQTHRYNSGPQMSPSGLTLAVTLTLNFQGQTWNWLYLSQKWSDCHETKSKHIDWTLGLKCDHWVWPWTWPWPWIFNVKYEICYLSAKSGPKVRCSDLPDCDWFDFKCRRAVDSSSFNAFHVSERRGKSFALNDYANECLLMFK